MSRFYEFEINGVDNKKIVYERLKLRYYISSILYSRLKSRLRFKFIESGSESLKIILKVLCRVLIRPKCIFIDFCSGKHQSWYDPRKRV